MVPNMINMQNIQSNNHMVQKIVQNGKVVSYTIQQNGQTFNFNLNQNVNDNRKNSKILEIILNN